MRFHLDHFAFEQALVGPFSDALLQTLDQALVLLHGAGAHCHMVVLGEHPGIEVRRNIRADVHLGQILVIGHLFGRKLDPLLEGDGHVVVPGIHRFGHAGVGTVSADDQVHIEALLFAGGAAAAVVGVMKGVGTLSVVTGVDLLDQTVHQRGAEVCGTVAQIGIEHFAAAHADESVVVVSKGIQLDIHLPIGGGDHLHVANLTVDDVVRQVKFLNHAERNCSTTGFGVIQLAFKQPGLDSGFGQNFSGTGSAGTATDNRNTQHLSPTPLDCFLKLPLS